MNMKKDLTQPAGASGTGHTNGNGQLSITEATALRYGMSPGPFEQTLRATVFPSSGTREEFAAFLLIAKHYNLNPIAKEIFAFPKKGGGIIPVVSIDGWMNLLNSHPAFDGMNFDETHDSGGGLISITCTIYRKDRSHPISVTEHLSECIRATDPWKMAHRMLRHKAAIQCARYAMGFAGIYDEDEAERFAAYRDVTPTRGPAPPAQQIGVRPNLAEKLDAIAAAGNGDGGPPHDAVTGEIIEDAATPIIQPWNRLQADTGAGLKGSLDPLNRKAILGEAYEKAKGGVAVFNKWLGRLNAPDHELIADYIDSLLAQAEYADTQRGKGAPAADNKPVSTMTGDEAGAKLANILDERRRHTE